MEEVAIKHRNLTKEERVLIINRLNYLHDGTKLPHGALQKVADEFFVGRWSVSRLWKRARANNLFSSPCVNSKKKRSGRHPKYNPVDISEAIANIPLSLRTTIRSTATVLGIPYQTLHLYKEKTGCTMVHSSAIKPSLDEDNKVARFMHCVDHVGANGLFKSMNHILHADEKWFYMTRVNQKYYLAQGEDTPERTTKHKGHIEKVMCLAVVGCPHYYTPAGMDLREGHQHYFDGKIGIWPVGEMGVAQRNSNNRPAGTPVWRNAKMDRNVYRDMLINLVLPAIQEKFPCHAHATVLLQQDNAPAHCLQNDPAFSAACTERQLNLQLFNQPANSPDLNINDLAFFNSLQKMQLKNPTTTSLELIETVKNAYRDYPPCKLRDAYLTLQGCMNCIMDCNGGNDYKIPHLGKARMERLGLLPTTLVASPIAVDFWNNYMVDNDEDD
jgi:hypothetical protein